MCVYPRKKVNESLLTNTNEWCVRCTPARPDLNIASRLSRDSHQLHSLSFPLQRTNLCKEFSEFFLFCVPQLCSPFERKVFVILYSWYYTVGSLCLFKIVNRELFDWDLTMRKQLHKIRWVFRQFQQKVYWLQKNCSASENLSKLTSNQETGVIAEMNPVSESQKLHM